MQQDPRTEKIYRSDQSSETDCRSEIQNIATHSLSLISTTGKDSRDEQKISTAIKKDLEQNITNMPEVRQRQVLAIQKAPRTADIPLLQDHCELVNYRGKYFSEDNILPFALQDLPFF